MTKPYHYVENRIFSPRDIIKEINPRSWPPGEENRSYVVIDFDPEGINVNDLKSDNTLGQSYQLRNPNGYEKIGRWDGDHTMFITLDLPLDVYMMVGGRSAAYKIAMKAISDVTADERAEIYKSGSRDWWR